MLLPFMKVYPDANIYIAYLLGQKGEAMETASSSRVSDAGFPLWHQNIMFAEVAQRCGGNGILLLQKNIDDFQKAGKP